MVAGWQTNDSTPPRLSAPAERHSSRRYSKACAAASRCPNIRKEIISSNPRCCFPRDFVLRVRGQTRIEHALDLGMVLKIAGDGHAVFVVLRHSHGKRFDAARHQKAIHGGRGR